MCVFPFLVDSTANMLRVPLASSCSSGLRPLVLGKRNSTFRDRGPCATAATLGLPLLPVVYYTSLLARRGLFFEKGV